MEYYKAQICYSRFWDIQSRIEKPIRKFDDVNSGEVGRLVARGDGLEGVKLEIQRLLLLRVNLVN